jgi:flagellar biosynthesis/type III secretory pathway protein FliH
VEARRAGRKEGLQEGLQKGRQEEIAEILELINAGYSLDALKDRLTDGK